MNRCTALVTLSGLIALSTIIFWNEFNFLSHSPGIGSLSGSLESKMA
jgi:hypothetical protein